MLADVLAVPEVEKAKTEAETVPMADSAVALPIELASGEVAVTVPILA
jgi:hypothetical protein